MDETKFLYTWKTDNPIIAITDFSITKEDFLKYLIEG